jgi:hypothetical protein
VFLWHDVQPLLHPLHGGKIIFGHGLVVGAGIDHGGTQFLVTQESLNGGDAAARVQKLRGASVPQAMRKDLHAQVDTMKS